MSDRDLDRSQQSRGPGGDRGQRDRERTRSDVRDHAVRGTGFSGDSGGYGGYGGGQESHGHGRTTPTMGDDDRSGSDRSRGATGESASRDRGGDRYGGYTQGGSMQGGEGQRGTGYGYGGQGYDGSRTQSYGSDQGYGGQSYPSSGGQSYGGQSYGRETGGPREDDRSSFGSGGTSGAMARGGYGREHQRHERASDSQGPGFSAHSRGTHPDPDYHQWREEQIRTLDNEYQEWRQDRYKKFSDDFNQWRASRSGLRAAGVAGAQSSASPGDAPGAQSGVQGSSSTEDTILGSSEGSLTGTSGSTGSDQSTTDRGTAGMTGAGTGASGVPASSGGQSTSSASK